MKQALLTVKDMKQFIVNTINQTLTINRQQMGAPELADVLKIHPDTIRKWTHAGLTHHKLRTSTGNYRNVYKVDEVIQWMKDNGKWN